MLGEPGKDQMTPAKLTKEPASKKDAAKLSNNNVSRFLFPAEHALVEQPQKHTGKRFRKKKERPVRIRTAPRKGRGPKRNQQRSQNSSNMCVCLNSDLMKIREQPADPQQPVEYDSGYGCPLWRHEHSEKRVPKN